MKQIKLIRMREEKYMKKKIALVLVAVMAATALFACGIYKRAVGN